MDRSNGHMIKTRGPEDIACAAPMRIGIVSTGLIFHDTDERASPPRTPVRHRWSSTRRIGLGARAGSATRTASRTICSSFMLEEAGRTREAPAARNCDSRFRPTSTSFGTCYDILNARADHVRRARPSAPWPDIGENALPVLTGEEAPLDEQDAWEWLRTVATWERRYAVLDTSVNIW